MILAGYAPRQLEGILKKDIGNQYVRDQNTAVFVGEVVHTYTMGGEQKKPGDSPGMILTLKTQSPHRRNFPKVTVFKRQAEITGEMKVGDIIAVTGVVQTARIAKAGSDWSKHVKSIVGTDIDWFVE